MSTGMASKEFPKRPLRWKMEMEVPEDLMECISRHDEQLALLWGENDRSTVDIIVKVCEKVEKGLTRVEERLSKVEKIVLTDGKRNIGQRIDEQCKDLKIAMQKLEKKAGNDDLKVVEETMERKIEAVQRTSSSREHAERLWETQRGLSESMTALQSLLATKIDRSEAGHFTSVLSKVGSVSDYMDRADERINALETDIKSVSDTLNSHAQSNVEIQKDLRTLRKELIKKATSSDLVAVKTELSCAKIHRKQHNSSLDGLEEKVSHILGDYGLHSEVQTLQKQVKHCLESKASIKNIDSVWEGLRHELSLKASAVEVAELSKASVATAKQAALAARFVEWFSSRGEAYQHNLNVVEQKIEELAVDSLPGKREPYGGRVRFTPMTEGMGTN